MQRCINEPEGQVIIYVALALFILIGFTALAVDGGNVYVTRRNLQDAADAGALAGARQLCFEEDTSFSAVEVVAQEYAVSDNLADEAEVTVIDGYVVTVVTRTSTETFFGGIIGLQEVAVATSASAMCSSAVEQNNIWPVAADRVHFEDIDCDEESGEGDLVFVFVNNYMNSNFYCEGDIPDGVEPGENDQICQCGVDLNFDGPNGGIVIGDFGSSHIKWLNLFEPSPPWVGVGYTHNCSINEIGYWLEYGHPGPVVIGDCLPGQPGFIGNSRPIQDAIDTYVNHDLEERIREVVLYDTPCDDCVIDGQPGDDLCCNQNDYYRVSGFGCIAVVGYDDNVVLPRLGGGECQFEALIIQKRCGLECESATGSGSAGISDPYDVNSVSLIE